MTQTYYDRLTAEDTRSIEDLCRPLSAKVMPKIASLSLHGTLTDQQAIAKQRRTTRQGKSGKGKKE